MKCIVAALALLFALTACGAASSPVQPAAVSHTPTPSPVRSLSAADVSACQQAKAAQDLPDETITRMQTGKRTFMVLVTEPFKNASEKQTALAAAAQDEKVQATITALANANKLALAKAEAWRRGTLDMVVEVQAVNQAKIEMLAACSAPAA